MSANTLLRKVMCQANMGGRIYAVNQIITLSGSIIKPLMLTPQREYKLSIPQSKRQAMLC